ncbi:MAG: hypothetical protein M3063_07450 [Actinomycetota bacterium]|nr:hypothetical protein [Actinomycetota bacterium]
MDEADVRWLWWPLHGGAGVSTLAQLDPRGAVSGPGKFSPDEWMVVVCRTTALGLLSAKKFASEAWPGASKVVGLVTVADTPGRLPTGLRQLRRHAEGGYRYAWHLPWIEPWRCGEPVMLQTAPRAVRGVIDQIGKRVSTADEGGLVPIVAATPGPQRFAARVVAKQAP